MSVALAEMVGRDGRVYAVDSDPLARDEVARAAAAHSPGDRTHPGRRRPRPARAGRPRVLPLPPDARARPAVVVTKMAAAVRPGGWVVAQEPITTAGRIGGVAPVHARRPPSRRRRPASRPGAAGRTRGGRRLGRGTRGCGPRSCGALPRVAHRCRPRRGPGRPATPGHGRRTARRAGLLPEHAGPAGRVAPRDFDTRLLEAAAGALEAADELVARAVPPSATRGGVDANQVVAYDLAHAAAAVATARAASTTAPTATSKPDSPAAFVADVLADLAGRVAGREALWGVDAGLGRPGGHVRRRAARPLGPRRPRHRGRAPPSGRRLRARPRDVPPVRRGQGAAPCRARAPGQRRHPRGDHRGPGRARRVRPVGARGVRRLRHRAARATTWAWSSRPRS